MKIRVDVLSDKKGSNPGGLCTVYDSKGNRVLDGYFKYCHSSYLPKSSPFLAEHQPVLEVLASLQARKFGLITPDCYVLMNKDLVVFNNLHNSKDHSGKKYYFVSKLEPNPTSETIDKRLIESIKHERAYLESLLLRDFDSRANIIYKEGRVGYIDLGCFRFACANDGFLKEAPGNFSLIPDRQLRKILRKLENYNIRRADGAVINLLKIVEDVSDMFIPILNPPGGYAKVESLINKNEVHAIQNYFAQSFFNSRRKFKEEGLLIE
mgnify:CR=1 FL=1